MIAGHETTSGLLSFAIYSLLKNPGVLNKARKEVDEVLGSDKPRQEHIPRLVYIDQVHKRFFNSYSKFQILKETLRLYPTAPLITVTPYKRHLLGGKYEIQVWIL